MAQGLTKGTATSSFGTSGRINHDSSKFYNSKLYDGDLSLQEYLKLLREAFSETYRVLVNGGRKPFNGMGKLAKRGQSNIA
jgi:hypothetical protein